MNLFKGLKINALLTAILYVIIGLVFIIFPDIVLQYVPIALAVLIALVGIYYIIDYFRHWQVEYRNNGLAIGIMLLFIAFFLFLQREIIPAIIPSLLGLAVVVSGTLKLQNAIVLHRQKDSLWIAVLILAFICLVLGVIFILNPFATSHVLVIVVGVSLLASGLSDLVILILISHRAKVLKKQINAAMNPPVQATPVEPPVPEEPSGPHAEG